MRNLILGFVLGAVGVGAIGAWAIDFDSPLRKGSKDEGQDRSSGQPYQNWKPGFIEEEKAPHKKDLFPC